MKTNLDRRYLGDPARLEQVDQTDPKCNSRTRQRTSRQVADKTPPALIQIGDDLYSGTELIQTEQRDTAQPDLEEIIESTVDKIEQHATIHDFTQVGHCVREAIESAHPQVWDNAFDALEKWEAAQ